MLPLLITKTFWLRKLIYLNIEQKESIKILVDNKVSIVIQYHPSYKN